MAAAARVILETSAEAAQDVGGNVVPIIGIDITKQDEMGEQDAPVGTEPRQQSLPVKPPAAGTNKMVDVGAVEAFAFHDKRLLPDHFFDGDELDARPQYFPRRGMFKP